MSTDLPVGYSTLPGPGPTALGPAVEQMARRGVDLRNRHIDLAVLIGAALTVDRQAGDERDGLSMG